MKKQFHYFSLVRDTAEMHKKVQNVIEEQVIEKCTDNAQNEWLSGESARLGELKPCVTSKVQAFKRCI